MKCVKLPAISTKNKPGKLTPIDIGTIVKTLEIDFKLDRMFYVSELDSKDEDISSKRGCHANRYIKEVIVCINGECCVKTFNGKKWDQTKLTKNMCTFIDANIWIEYGDFVNCILLVLIQDIDRDEEKDHDPKIHDMDQYIKERNHV